MVGLNCGWHSYTLGLSYISLPYEIDAGSTCGEDKVFSVWDGFSIDAGHEYAETITDPDPDTGWVDTNDTTGDGELGDKCAWQDLTTLSLSTSTFAMQPLWSNDAYAATGTGCTMGWPDNVVVSQIGSQSTTVHTIVSLHIRGGSSAGYPVSFSGYNLPPGLSINSATGLISGTPTVTGSYPVSVTARDVSGGQGSMSFTWTVNGSGDTVTVTNPGTVTTDAYADASFQIEASSSSGYLVTSYTATGLPFGMSISSSGLISGTARTADDYEVRVIATDSAGAAGSATFDWIVTPLTPPCGGARKICCGGARKIPCLGGHESQLPGDSRVLTARAPRLASRKPA